MPAGSTTKIALIGTGMVARTHLMAIADLPDLIKLKTVVSRTQESADRFAQEAAEMLGYEVGAETDIGAVASDPEIDWALLITPPNARMDIVEALASAGKSILMEKPVERNHENARTLVEICERNTVSLGIVFQHRAREASKALAELIEAGSLGKLVIAEVIVPWWREQSYYDEPGRGTYERDGGGVLISQAIHTLDLMLSLTGPVKRVQAMAHTTDVHQMEAEDYVTAALRFRNGAAGSLIASTASFPGDAESITLHFTNCVALLKAGELHLTWRDGRKEQVGASAATGGGADPMAFTHDWHRDVIADFAEACSEGRPPMVTGREALEVHALIDAVMASSNSGTAVGVSGA